MSVAPKTAQVQAGVARRRFDTRLLGADRTARGENHEDLYLFGKPLTKNAVWLTGRVLVEKLYTSSRPLRSAALNGPGSAISRRAVSTWSQTFHNSTPRTRPFRK
jgi:hypothetical protein